MSIQQLILVRGLPGSGKSTAAQKIAMFDQNNRVVIEGDHYFETAVPGTTMKRYHFDGEWLADAPRRCRRLTEACLTDGLTAIVSNTFTTLKEMKPYMHMAEDMDIPIMVIKCEGTYGSVHNVPAHVMDRMEARWEPYDGEVTTEECQV